jgi:hypothetical protein
MDEFTPLDGTRPSIVIGPTASWLGVEAFHWHASDGGRRLAERLVEEVCRAMGLPKRPYPVLASRVGEKGYYRLLRYVRGRRRYWR